MQKPEASTISSVVARGSGKATRVDSARDLRSSVQANGRLVGAEAEKR